jgi:thiosulfate dehydrogenase [quinone] large subunit
MSPKAGSGRNGIAFAGLRISVGVLFLIFGQYKVLGRTFIFGGGFEGWINRFLAGGAYPFMAPVLKHFVLIYPKPLAILVALGECAIGISLVIGLWSRLASGFGCLYMLVLLFSSNYPGPDVPTWQYYGASLSHSVLALCFAAFAFGDPDASLAIAGWFRKHT